MYRRASETLTNTYCACASSLSSNSKKISSVLWFVSDDEKNTHIHIHTVIPSYGKFEFVFSLFSEHISRKTWAMVRGCYDNNDNNNYSTIFKIAKFPWQQISNFFLRLFYLLSHAFIITYNNLKRKQQYTDR